MPGMPGALPFGGPKESAWERGLKVSKRIREEVKRNEKSDEESEESFPNSKVVGMLLKFGLFYEFMIETPLSLSCKVRW